MMNQRRCSTCLGSGKCPECFGSGSNTHLNADDPNCPKCGGSGACPDCGDPFDAVQDSGLTTLIIE